MGKFDDGSGSSITQRLNSEAAMGLLEINRTPNVPTVQDPGTDPTSVQRTLRQIKSWIDMREANSGSVLDKAITFRDLLKEGAMAFKIGGNVFAGTAPSSLSIGTSTSSGTILGYLATPPAPTALSAQGAFKNVILTWSLELYANHAYTEIWRANSNALGAATLIGTTQYANIYTDANVVVGATYYYWVRAVNTAGVLGPFNAVGGTSAALLTIGNTDLSDLVVTAEKLSNGTFPNINLVMNPGAEDGTKAWYKGTSSTVSAVLSADNTQQAGGTQSFKMAKSAAGDLLVAASTTFPVIPGETYSLKVRAKAAAAVAAGFYLRIIYRATYPVSNFVDDVNYAGGANFTDVVVSGPLTTSWQVFEGSVTVPAGMFWASVNILSDISLSTNQAVWFDDVSCGRQITASFLAANSIAVGTAAIQNGAIVNAMIANATIDSAKIASVDAGTITAGTLAAARIAAGSLNANKLTAGTITTDRLVANAATSAGNSALSITGTTYTAVTSLSPSNQNIVSLTTTGAPVTGQGWLKITGRVAATTVTFDNVSIAFSIDDGATVVATCGAQLAQCFISHSTPTYKHIWGNAAIPISFRYTPAAAAYTFRAVSMSVAFLDTSGNPISLTGDYDVIGYLVVQENKV